MSFTAEFTTDIQYIKGKFNVVADALSRINSVKTSDNNIQNPNLNAVVANHPEDKIIDFSRLARDQETSDEMASYHTATTGWMLNDVDIDSSPLLCDMPMGAPRPILPSSWTRPGFNKIHGLSHAGVRPTQTALVQRFVWNGMKRDIRKWCKESLDCQASKVHRHIRSPLVERLPPSDRFCSLHVDLVGPLPVSHGMTYLFTIIDRFTRGSEAISLPNALASTCVTALLHHWVARFGIPEDIVSDRGRQFTSNLWPELNKMRDIEAKTTTAYHPQANGIIERLHRQLKAALKARTTSPNWFEEPRMVLLGIHSSWRVDPNCSPAELVYGCALRIPGEFFLQPRDIRTQEPDIAFLRHLQQTMRPIQPVKLRFHGNQTSFLPATLLSADYVYIRKDSHKHPIQRPYDGPFLVVKKSDKYFTLEMKDHLETVWIDRLKAAFVTKLTTSVSNKLPSSPDTPALLKSRPATNIETSGTATGDKPKVTTRAARVPRHPVRFQ